MARAQPMKVDPSFKAVAELLAKEQNCSMRDATRQIAMAFNLSRGFNQVKKTDKKFLDMLFP